MERRLRNLALASVALAALAIASAACSKSKGGESGDPRCDETVVPYEGYATDEACKAMLDAEDAGQVQTGTGNAPTVATIGSNGAVAASASTLTIAFTSPLDLDGDTFLFDARAHRAATFARAPHRHLRRDLGHELVALISPVSTAWAHLPPMTGALHMIRVKGITGRTAPFVVFTTKLHYAITGSNLAPILATASPMQVELTDAYLTENRILTPSTDGPFRPASDTTFHVQ